MAKSKDDAGKTVRVPGWLTELGPSFLRDVKRIARKLRITEASLMREGLDLAQKKHRAQNAKGDDEQVYLEGVGESMPMSRLKAILREAGKIFGGKTKLTAEGRANRASEAAKKMWEKRRENERRK